MRCYAVGRRRTIRLYRDRDQLVPLTDIGHIELDTPIDVLGEELPVEPTAVSSPEIEVRLAWSVVRIAQIERDGAAIRITHRAVADGILTLPANAATYIEALQTTFA